MMTNIFLKEVSVLSFVLRLTLVLLPTLVNAISGEPHHTTAFLSPPHTTNTLFSYTYYSTNHFWNKHGKSLPAHNHFQRQTFLLYAEYAVDCQNSFWLHGGYSSANESINGRSKSLEDLELGWKWLLYSGKTSAFTSQFIAIIPTGKERCSIRYGKLGGEFDLLYSDIFCFLQHFGWYDLSLGYRFYHGGPSDQIRASAALGYDIKPYASVIAMAQLDYGVFNGKSRFHRNNIALDRNYRLLEMQIECVVDIFTNASLTFGLFKHVWGENVGKGGGFFGGAWIIF